jgi:hypothetical protein
LTGPGARRLALLLVTTASFALAGCAAPQASAMREALRSEPIAGVALRTRLDGVPFHPQLEYHCGPASLAMVMSAAGHHVHPDTLAAHVFVPARQGSLQPEMLAAARRRGMLATELPGTLEAVLREVSAGTPVLVLQNLGLQMMPRWHYAVVVGYDLPAGYLELHSGETERMRMRIDNFEHTWARGGHWAIAVTQPATLPRTATQSEAVRAAVALERTDKAAAELAYESVLRRWPGDRLALFGRANLRYAAGDADTALALYRRTVAEHPDFADAWNNLAVALAQAGRNAEARTAADRAIQLGGTRVDAYRSTRAGLPAD